MNDEQLVQETKPASTPSKLIYAASVVTIIVAAILIILGIVGALQNNNQQEALDKQTDKTNELVQEVKSLTEQNQKTSQQAANYAYCNAVLLAEYTQTLSPIDIEDLNSCVLNSFPATATNPAPATPQSNAVQPNISAPSSPVTNNTTNNTTNNPPAATPAPVMTPTPQAPAPTLSTTPTGLLPGIGLNLPCVNALGLIQLGCRQ